MHFLFLMSCASFVLVLREQLIRQPSEVATNTDREGTYDGRFTLGGPDARAGLPEGAAPLKTEGEFDDYDGHRLGSSELAAATRKIATTPPQKNKLENIKRKNQNIFLCFDVCVCFGCARA